MKRILSVLLSVLIVLSTLFNVGFTVYADNIEFLYSDAQTYVADSISRGVIDKEGNADGASELKIALNHKYTYQLIAEELVEDELLMFNSGFWQNLKKVLSGDLLKLVNWEEELCVLLIIDYLNYYSQTEEFESNYIDNTVKFTEDIYDCVLDYVVKEYDNCMDNIKNNVKQVISKQSVGTAKELTEKWGVAKKLKKYKTMYGDIEKVSKTAEEYYKNLTKALSVQKADESRIEFLKQMKNAGADNKYFANAVDKVITMYESSYATLAFDEGSKTMINYGMKTLFKEAIKACPGASEILESMKIYTEGLNWLFNSDDISENNLKLTIIYTMGSYAGDALRNAKEVFTANPTQENAQAFLNAYDGYLKYHEYATNSTKGFVSSALFDGVVNHIINIFFDDNKLTHDKLMGYLDEDLYFSYRLEHLEQRHYDLYFAYLDYDCEIFVGEDDFIDEDESVSINYSLIPKSSLEYSIIDNYVYIDKYNGNLFAPMIPYEIDGFYVKGIKDNAFSENVNMRYLYIPGTVDTIGSKAFLNCFNLKEVYMPNGNTIISDDAFNAYVYNSIDGKEYILDKSLDIMLYSTTGSDVEKYCTDAGITLDSLDWDGEETKKPCMIDNTYYIGCVAEYMWLREQALSSLKGKNIVMSGVFNFNAKNINNEYKTKEEKLECDIHIVSAEFNNLNCYNNRNYGYQVNGLFPSASVKELRVVDVVINNPDVTQSTTLVDSCYDGALFGNLEIKSGGNVILDSIEISGGEVYADQGFTGGLVGNLVVNSNAQVSVSDIYTDYSLGGDVEYMETMSAGGLIGRFENYGNVRISTSNIMGDFKSYGGYNTVNQSHPGRVGGIISDVYNYGDLQIDEIDVNISAGTSGGSSSTTHYIGAILSYIGHNSGNIKIENIKSNINFSKGILNGFVGGGSFSNLSIDKSIFINSGSQYSINTRHLSSVNYNFTKSYYLSDNMYLYNPTSGSYYTSEQKVMVNNILSKGKTLDELINVDLYKTWDTDKVWLVDGKSLPSLKFSDNESTDYYISVESIKDGVSSYSTTLHDSGDNYTCKFNTYDGYSINKVLVDDIYLGSLSSYSFNNIHKNYEIKVYYEPFASATIDGVIWKYKLVDNQVCIYGCESKLSDITIPTSIDGYTVTGFLESTFSYKSGLVRVTIPDTITKIVDSSFSGCSDLTEISIGKNVNHIGERAFHSCYNLATVIYNNTIAKWQNIKVLDYNQSLSNATVVCTDGTIYPPKIESGNKVYFDNSLTKWDVVYCYMWEGENTFNNNTWPGVKMIYLENNIWYYTLTDNYKNIIFTNGKQQSKDLSYPGDNYIATPILNSSMFDVSWKKSEYNVFEIGDVNTDGQIDIKDVTCIQKHIVESDIIPKENFALCDIDKNNSIDIKDATKLQLIIAGAK